MKWKEVAMSMVGDHVGSVSTNIPYLMDRVLRTVGHDSRTSDFPAEAS